MTLPGTLAPTTVLHPIGTAVPSASKKVGQAFQPDGQAVSGWKA